MPAFDNPPSRIDLYTEACMAKTFALMTAHAREVDDAERAALAQQIADELRKLADSPLPSRRFVRIAARLAKHWHEVAWAQTPSPIEAGQRAIY